jgi:hypothetical protein
VTAPALPAALQPTQEPSALAQELAAFVGPISLAEAELYVSELDIRIAKLWTEEQATPIPGIRRRLEAERTELETLRADLWFARLHPEQAIVPEEAEAPEEWPEDELSRDGLPIIRDPVDPCAVPDLACPVCGSRQEKVSADQVCTACAARHQDWVESGACVGCGHPGDFPACPRCEIPF